MHMTCGRCEWIAGRIFLPRFLKSSQHVREDKCMQAVECGRMLQIYKVLIDVKDNKVCRDDKCMQAAECGRMLQIYKVLIDVQ
jgi:hypothetical protein